jgi:hypothetical protein
MKAKAMLKALKNMREDAIICFGAGHKPNWVRGFAQFSQDDKTLYLMDETPGAQEVMITVEILRDALEQGRDDTVVKTFDNLEVLFMTSHAAGHLVYVETEADIDMPSKLKEIWDNAVTEGLDEDTVYLELLDRGITPEVVKKYGSREHGLHMAKYCVEHGLMSEDEFSFDDFVVVVTISGSKGEERKVFQRTDRNGIFTELLSLTGSSGFSIEAATSMTCPGLKPSVWGTVCGHTVVSVTAVPVWAAENIVRKKKEFIVHAVNHGTAKVMACSEAEALNLANSLSSDMFDWKSELEVVEVKES